MSPPARIACLTPAKMSSGLGGQPAPVDEKRTLYVGGLDDSVTQDVLLAAFAPFGDIVGIELPMTTASLNVPSSPFMLQFLLRIRQAQRVCFCRVRGP